MNEPQITPAGTQGLSVDKFLYFFLGMRKGEIRRRVQALEKRYPNESPGERAARVVVAQRPLSLLGGTLLELPMLLPAVGLPLKLLGIAGATSALARMHLSMILEIALIHGFDIDEKARLKEMAVVIATTGLASAVPSLSRGSALGGPLRLLSGTVAAASAGEMIGRSAISFYGRRAGVPQKRPDRPSLRGVPSSAGADSAA